MSKITFKATRRLHDSGYRVLDKSGDLQYDLIHPSQDAIWLTITEPQSIIIDCDRSGKYFVKFDGNKAYIHNPPTEDA